MDLGDLHTLTCAIDLGESGVASIEALFNRGPYRTAGGESIVNATSWDPNAEDPTRLIGFPPSA